MISYNLVCEKGHEFEGWFNSSGAYDEQRKKGVVVCPHCGSKKVSKGLMAPNVSVKENSKISATAGPNPPAELVEMVRRVREHVRGNADYVGDQFAEEARKIHYEETEARGIYGEASMDDAVALHEEGIEFYPLPGLPEDKN